MFQNGSRYRSYLATVLIAVALPLFFLSLWQGCSQPISLKGQKLETDQTSGPPAGDNVVVRERVPLTWIADGTFSNSDKATHIEGKSYYRLMPRRKCLHPDGSGRDTHQGRIEITDGEASELADTCATEESSLLIENLQVSPLNPRLLIAPGRIYQERGTEPILIEESEFPAVFCRSETATGLINIYIRQSAENFLTAPALTVDVSRGHLQGSENTKEKIDSFPLEISYSAGTAVFSSADYKFDLSLQEGAADADWTALLRATAGTEILEMDLTCQTNDWNRVLPVGDKKPEVRLTSIPPQDSDSPIAIFSFDAMNSAAVECRVDGQTPLPCMSPFDFTNLADGPHTVTITGRNDLGTSSVSFTWNIAAVARPEVYFADIDRQILRVSCGGCHIGFSYGGISYRNYTSTLRTVVRGNAAASRFYDSVARNRMPSGGISPLLKQMIADWINAGAPERP